MKTILLNILLITLCIWIPEYTNAIPYMQPVRTMEIPYATEEIIIDAVADDCYSASQSTEGFLTIGSTGTDNDYTLTFQVCYDVERLYILATILDDYVNEIMYTTSMNPWTWDNVEVFISLDTTGTTEHYDTNTIQLRFNRGIQDSAQTPGRASQNEYHNFVYYENTADGWVLEVGIPWTAVLSDAQLPDEIERYLTAVNGFDVMGADNDTDGPDARDCQTAWDSDGEPDDVSEDLAWNTRTYFGIMTLGTADINYRPVANAGPNQIVDENTLVTLDGTGSHDPESQPITYLWSAPSQISLSDNSSATPSFTAPEVDINTLYGISLTVNDGDRNSYEDVVIIHVLQVEPPESIKSEEISPISIYPIPTNHLLRIKSGILIYNIEVMDMNGVVIFQKAINRLDVEINFESLAKGIYLMRLNTKAGPVLKRFTII